MGAEGRILPGRGVGDGDDVLVRREHQGLQARVGALEGVDEAEGVDRLFLCGGVTLSTRQLLGDMLALHVSSLVEPEQSLDRWHLQPWIQLL